MKIINLTPHDINILTDAGDITIPASGQVARCATTRQTIDVININGINVNINKTLYGTVDGLPDPAPDTLYIVSALVAQAAKDRQDLVIPDDSVRDDQGKIIGCRALARV
jgi:hypothetical protein